MSRQDFDLKIIGWDSFQSYKDRKPPWIRLHRSLLDNPDFQKMSMNAKAVLPQIWLLASEDKDPRSGLIRRCYKNVTFRLRISNDFFTETLREIYEAGFVVPVNEDGEEIELFNKIDIQSPEASNTADVTFSYRKSYESVTPETETEADTETKLKKEKLPKEKKQTGQMAMKPDGVDEQTWLDFLEVRKAKKSPLTQTAVKMLQTEAGKAGWNIQDAVEEAVARNWQSFKAHYVKDQPAKSKNTKTPICL